MDHPYLKKQIKNDMSKTTIAIIIYVLGLIFGAFFDTLEVIFWSPSPCLLQASRWPKWKMHLVVLVVLLVILLLVLLVVPLVVLLVDPAAKARLG